MKKDQIVVLTSGDYSDYSIRGHWKVKKDFSLKAEQEAYLEALPLVPVLLYGERVKDPTARFGERYIRFDEPRPTGQMRKEYASCDGLQAFLIRKGLIEALEVTEVNYDDIGSTHSNVD